MSFWSGKFVLVTGGAGMIGSFLVEGLARAGAYVTVVDDVSRGCWGNLSQTTCERQTLRLGNHSFVDGVTQMAFGGKFAVFHLAAKVTGIQYNRHHHLEMLDENLRINLAVSDLLKRHRPERYIFVSTACVYPHNAPVPTSEVHGKVGDPEPTNFGYGVAKWVGEQQARLIHQEGFTQTAIARFYNAAGPRDYYDWETSHVIPALIRKFEERHEPVVVWGSGLQQRSFVDCRDLAEGLMLVAKHCCDGKPTNIGHDREISIGDLAEMIKAVTGSASPIEFDASMPEGYERRAADMTRLKAMTGWTPARTLEMTIQRMVRDFRERYPNGCRD